MEREGFTIVFVVGENWSSAPVVALVGVKMESVFVCSGSTWWMVGGEGRTRG